MELHVPIHNTLRPTMIFQTLHFLINWMTPLRCFGFLTERTTSLIMHTITYIHVSISDEDSLINQEKAIIEKKILLKFLNIYMDFNVTYKKIFRG